MVVHRTDPAAGALARGPAKREDIEAVRRTVGAAERAVAQQAQQAAQRQEKLGVEHERAAARAARLA